MDIPDEQWAVVRRFLPGPERLRTSSKGGRPWRDPRDVLNAVLWVLRTGAPWADLPRRYPPPSTCHRRFQQWVKDGVLEKTAERSCGGLEKQRSPRFDRGIHRRLPRGGKKGGPLVGITRRGKATKIMAVADRNGLPLACWIASGPRNETKLVGETLDARFTRALPRKLVGDRAYDSDPLDRELKRRGIEMIAPQPVHPRHPPKTAANYGTVTGGAGSSNGSSPGCSAAAAWSPGGKRARRTSSGLVQLACARLLWNRL
jgi:transposase